MDADAPIGRGDLIREVTDLLRTTGRCTLIGPGGVGKTTVARSVSVAASDRDVVWIDAEPLRQLDELLTILLDRLDPAPIAGESPFDTLAAVITGRAVTIVIDGAEAIGSALVEFVREVPTGGLLGPWLLLTSRHQPAGLPGPIRHVEPLATAAERGRASPAETVFRRHFALSGGRTIDVDHHPAELALMVDEAGGLPLALELAAARAALVGFEIRHEARSEDHTLDDVLHRSLDLLDDDARALLLGLGSTVDTVPLDLARTVSNLAPRELDDALDALARYSLLLPVEGGITVLPPIRRSIRRIAVAEGTAGAADQRLQRWAVELCQSVTDDPDQRRLVSCAAELRAAIGISLDHPDGLADAVAIAGVLSGALATALQHRRSLDVLEALLASAATRTDLDDIDQLIELLRLTAIGRTHIVDVTAGEPLLDRADSLVPEAAAPDWHRSRLAAARAQIAFDKGDLPTAATYAKAATEAADKTADDQARLGARKLLADVLLEGGHLVEADATAAAVAARAVGGLDWLGGLAQVLCGMAAVDSGAFARATAIGMALLERARRTAQPFLELEAAFVLAAADPTGNRHLVCSVLDPPADSSSWLEHLQVERCRIMFLLIDADYTEAMIRAADSVVIADALPHRWEAIEGRLLLGDACLGAGERKQALVAYDEALTTAVRHGSALRAADALDGYAAVLHHDDAALAAAASTTARHVRLHHRAARRPRPWLTVPPLRRVPTPDGWLVDGVATEHAAEALAQVQTVDPTGRHSPISNLSPSEQAVARLVAAGHTNREIGAELHISRRTVETHIAHAFHKLDIRTRSRLASLMASATLDD